MKVQSRKCIRVEAAHLSRPKLGRHEKAAGNFTQRLRRVRLGISTRQYIRGRTKPRACAPQPLYWGKRCTHVFSIRNAS